LMPSEGKQSPADHGAVAFRSSLFDLGGRTTLVHR
jgi:hypothetical protein